MNNPQPVSSFAAAVVNGHSPPGKTAEQQEAERVAEACIAIQNQTIFVDVLTTTVAPANPDEETGYCDVDVQLQVHNGGNVLPFPTAVANSAQMLFQPAVKGDEGSDALALLVKQISSALIP